MKKKNLLLFVNRKILQIYLKLSKLVPSVRFPINYLQKYLPEEFYSLNDLDKKLTKYLPFTNGFFIEAGANDGISQSNSYYFSSVLGWKGILVEAIPELAKKCQKNRPNCFVENFALVSPNYPSDTITMKYCNLMSVVKGNLDEKAEIEFIDSGVKCQQNITPYEVNVPVATLNNILSKYKLKKIDLFSLDVEGYELEALSGIDLSIFKPDYILIETIWNREKILEKMLKYYDIVEELSPVDTLFRRKNLQQ